MIAERIPDLVGLDRPAPECDHLRLGPFEPLEHQLALTVPERRLALTLKEVRDRLAQASLQELVRVGERPAEARRKPAPERRLPRPHEADQHDLPRYLRHPIRCR